MATSQSRLKRMLQAIQNLFGFQVCVKKKSSSTDPQDEKLLNILNDLTVGISEVFDEDHRSFEEFLRCDRVSCKIDVLKEQIGQVRILYSLWKSGHDLDPQDITSKCRSLNLLVDCIRDDVFYAYLRLPAEQKFELLKKNKQVSSIFMVLGSLENEVAHMVKTMIPNGEILKVIRPLLKPEFNRMVFRRRAQDVSDYNLPRCFQTFQFCYNGLSFERPVKVDASTDPIEAKEWQKLNYTPTEAYGDFFYVTPYKDGNFDDTTISSPGNQRSRLTISAQQPLKCDSSKLLPQVVEDQDLAYWNTSGSYYQVAMRARSKNFATDDSGLRKERSGLSIVTDVDDVLDIPSNRFHDEPSHSVGNLDTSSSHDLSESHVNFWKLAADLIVENPVLY